MSLAPLRPTITFNRKDYSDCDLTFDDEHIDRYTQNITFTMKSTLAHGRIFAPLQVNYLQTDAYRCELMEQQVEILLNRLRMMFPDISVWLMPSPNYDKNPTNLTASGKIIMMKYARRAVELGNVKELMWMNEAELYTHIEKIILFWEMQDVEEKERLKKRRASDPLYEIKERLTRLGYGFTWRITIAQRDNEDESYRRGDTLLLVKCPALGSLDKYVLIGPFHLLCDFSDEQLRHLILDTHTLAIKNYRLLTTLHP